MKLKHLLGPLPNVDAAGFVTAIFVIFFVVLCFYVYRRERKPIYEHLGQLPLKEDSNG